MNRNYIHMCSTLPNYHINITTLEHSCCAHRPDRRFGQNIHYINFQMRLSLCVLLFALSASGLEVQSRFVERCFACLVEYKAREGEVCGKDQAR